MHKKMGGHRSRLGENDHLFSEQLSFYREPTSSEHPLAGASGNYAKNDAQKGCGMQLNRITLF